MYYKKRFKKKFIMRARESFIDIYTKNLNVTFSIVSLKPLRLYFCSFCALFKVLNNHFNLILYNSSREVSGLDHDLYLSFLLAYSLKEFSCSPSITSLDNLQHNSGINALLVWALKEA